MHPLSELLLTADVEEAAIRRLSLMSAVNALDERDRELIALRYGADLSAGEIGRLAGMRSGAVRVALKRARERLARALAETPTDTVPAPPPVTLELASRYLKVEPVSTQEE